MKPYILVTILSEKGWGGVLLTLAQFARSRLSLEFVDYYCFDLVGSLL